MQKKEIQCRFRIFLNILSFLAMKKPLSVIFLYMLNFYMYIINT